MNQKKYGYKKIEIDKRYPEENEAGRPHKPYEDFYNVLRDTDLVSFGSVADVGCSDGHLIGIFKERDERIRVLGIEYFDYHKNMPEAT